MNENSYYYTSMPTFAVVNDLDFLHLIRCAMTSHCCFNFHFCSDYDIILSQKKVEVKSFSHVQIFVTPWTVAYNAPPSMGFSRQEYWNGLPFECPGNLNSLNKILDNMCQPYKQWLFRQWEMQALGSVEMDSWSLV